MRILLSIEGIGMPLPGVRLSGSEGISELFRYDIHVVQGFDIGGIAGGNAKQVLGAHAFTQSAAGAHVCVEEMH